MERVEIDNLFDRRISFPNPDAQAQLARLVGVDREKDRLAKTLSVLVNPTGLRAWAQKFHRGAPHLLDLVLRRPPLILIAGDVGTGKTALAESIGDAVARSEDVGITLFPISLSARGTGRVGEMTQLISSAFDVAIGEARKLSRPNGRAAGGVLLLLDEADSLTQSREAQQMHHEDRAGVNAFIRGVDRLADARLPAAVLMCTNRLSAIDPAVRRRAAETFEFRRPVDEQRAAVLTYSLAEAGIASADIGRLVEATGAANGRAYGFTYSDLTQRLLPAILLDAYPFDPIRVDRAVAIAQSIEPTPPFNDESNQRRDGE